MSGPAATPSPAVVAVGSGRGWAYRTAWLVLPAADDPTVVRLLGLHQATGADWADGLDAVSGDREGHLVLVTPSVEARRYAVGSLAVFEDLLGSLLASDSGPLQAMADGLGGEVQFFASHPGADVYAWARLEPGGAHRFVVTSADDGVAVSGTATDIEETLGVDLITGDTDDDLDLIDDLVDETTVFAVARSWSIDPSTFEDDRGDHGPALLGRRDSPAS